MQLFGIFSMRVIKKNVYCESSINSYSSPCIITAVECTVVIGDKCL